MKIYKFFNDFRKACSHRGDVIGPRDRWTISDWAVEFGGEAGELLDAIKKLNRLRVGYDDKRGFTEAQLREKIREEVGDVRVSLKMLCLALDIDDDQAAVDKFNKTSESLGIPIYLEG